MITPPSPEQPPTDRELLAQLYMGRQAAIDTLRARYEKSMLATAQRRLRGCPDLVDDVIQNCWLIVCLKCGQKGTQDHFEPWLWTVLDLEIRKLLNSQSRRNTLFRSTAESGQSQELSHSSDRSPTPGHELEQEEILQMVLGEIEQMPSSVGNAILYRIVDGMSYEEVAKKLKIRPEYARKLVERARQRLNESFKTTLPEYCTPRESGK